MARDALEVLVGTGTIYIAPVGEAFPTNPATAVAGNWEDPGYSTEGWTFAVDRTFEDVLVAEEVDPLRVLKTAQTIEIRGTLAQASLENLEIAFGGGAIADDTPSAGFRTYTPPASDSFDEFAVLFRTEAPPGDGTEFRDIQAPRAIATGAVEMQHAKAPQITEVDVAFRLLIPSAGSIYTIIDDKV
jgi:hypothetical protein